MTDDRTLERLIAHLRAQVSELRRLERGGAQPGELEDRKRMVQRLQSYLAAAVLDAVRPHGGA